MNKRQFIKFLRKYREGVATDEERKLIESYYDLFEAGPGLESWLSKGESEQLKADNLNKVWSKIQQQEAEKKKEKVKKTAS